MKKYVMYGTFFLMIMASFLFTQNLHAQNLFDSISSNVSGSSGPVSATLNNSGASGTVSVGGNSLTSNVSSEGTTSASASLNGVASSDDGDAA